MSTAPQTTSAWKTFTFLNFAVAAVMMTGGIWFMEASITAKGFYAMAALMLVSSTVMLTKTIHWRSSMSCASLFKPGTQVRRLVILQLSDGALSAEGRTRLDSSCAWGHRPCG